MRGHELDIVCGPAGVGGTGKDGFKETIGKGRVEVTVPAKIWKVVMGSHGGRSRAQEEHAGHQCYHAE